MSDDLFTATMPTEPLTVDLFVGIVKLSNGNCHQIAMSDEQRRLVLELCRDWMDGSLKIMPERLDLDIGPRIPSPEQCRELNNKPA